MKLSSLPLCCMILVLNGLKNAVNCAVTKENCEGKCCFETVKTP
jgi:hypothetical protein